MHSEVDLHDKARYLQIQGESSQQPNQIGRLASTTSTRTDMKSDLASPMRGSTVGDSELTTAANFLQKNKLQTNCYSTVIFCYTKLSLCNANSFACSLENRDKPGPATLQRKCSGGIIVAIIT